jgi:hypothetical protein
MECNQKKLSKKPIQSTSNVDIENLVEFDFNSSEEINSDEEVSLLKPANFREKLPTPKSTMVAISFVNDLKALIDLTLSFDEKVDHHFLIS